MILLLAVLRAPGQEQDPVLHVSGYIKNLHEFSVIDRLNQLQWTTLVHNRMNLRYDPGNRITARVELRNRIYLGDNLSNTPGFSTLVSRDNGWMDLTWNAIDNGNVLVTSTLDRASLSYRRGNWDITLGRQRVNWGKNLIWNPNDLFNTYNFLDFDYEERPGSDAIRIQYYTGDFSRVELAAKKGRDEDDHIVALLYGFNRWSYDFQFISGIFQNDWVLGAGWAGNLKNSGFKGEVSYFVPYRDYLGSRQVISASLSVDYGFKNGIYLYGSVLYNSDSSDVEGGVENLSRSLVTAKNLMPFEFSGYLQFSREFSPIVSGSMSMVYSPTNQSVIAIPIFKYSLATDWELDILSYSFFEFAEYRSLGHSIFFRVRWSF